MRTNAMEPDSEQTRTSESDDNACCQVEAVVSVDERGQMVLPKAAREKAGIRPGDKLAVITWGESDSCCITLMKTSRMSAMVREVLNPVITEVFGTEGGTENHA